MIKKSAHVLAKRTGGSITFVPDADHLTIVDKTKDKSVNI